MKFDETQAQTLLSGSAADIDRAFQLIDRQLRGPLCRWLSRHFPNLGPDELAYAWSDTLAGALEGIHANRYDPTRSVLTGLRKIAFRKATDLNRRAASSQQVLSALSDLLLQPKWRRQGAPLTEPEGHEVKRLIEEAAFELPARQRLVWQRFLAGFPETRSMAVLCREVALLTQKPETVGGIKQALVEARRKIRVILESKGYALGA